jgi:hypothetical protein
VLEKCNSKSISQRHATVKVNTAGFCSPGLRNVTLVTPLAALRWFAALQANKQQATNTSSAILLETIRLLSRACHAALPHVWGFTGLARWLCAAMGLACPLPSTAAVSVRGLSGFQVMRWVGMYTSKHRKCVGRLPLV